MFTTRYNIGGNDFDVAWRLIDISSLATQSADDVLIVHAAIDSSAADANRSASADISLQRDAGFVSLATDSASGESFTVPRSGLTALRHAGSPQSGPPYSRNFDLSNLGNHALILLRDDVPDAAFFELDVTLYSFEGTGPTLRTGPLVSPL